MSHSKIRNTPIFTKVIMIGDYEVGKTSILNKHFLKKPLGVYRRTMSADFITKNLSIDGKELLLQIVIYK